MQVSSQKISKNQNWRFLDFHNFNKLELKVLKKFKELPNTDIIISFKILNTNEPKSFRFEHLTQDLKKTTGQPGLTGVQYFRTALKAFSNTRCTVLHSRLVEPVLCV